MRHPSELIPSQSTQRIGELTHVPPLTSDGPAEPVGWPHDDGSDDAHYARLREEHARRLDEEHRDFRRERFARDFAAWRETRRQPDGRLPPGSRGEADLAGDTGQGLFERS